MLKKNACEFEHAVVNFLKSGVSTDKTSAHLQACADCQETARVVSFFQTNLKLESPPTNLPVAGLIWWKSRLREKRRAIERAGQPILIVQIVAAIIFGGVFIWLFNSGSLEFLSLDRLFNSIDKLFVPLLIGIVGFLFVCSIVIFTLRRYLLEK